MSGKACFHCRNQCVVAERNKTNSDEEREPFHLRCWDDRKANAMEVQLWETEKTPRSRTGRYSWDVINILSNTNKESDFLMARQRCQRAGSGKVEVATNVELDEQLGEDEPSFPTVADN